MWNTSQWSSKLFFFCEQQNSEKVLVFPTLLLLALLISPNFSYVIQKKWWKKKNLSFLNYKFIGRVVYSLIWFKKTVNFNLINTNYTLIQKENLVFCNSLHNQLIFFHSVFFPLARNLQYSKISISKVSSGGIFWSISCLRQSFWYSGF